MTKPDQPEQEFEKIPQNEDASKIEEKSEYEARIKRRVRQIRKKQPQQSFEERAEEEEPEEEKEEERESPDKKEEQKKEKTEPEESLKERENKPQAPEEAKPPSQTPTQEIKPELETVEKAGEKAASTGAKQAATKAASSAAADAAASAAAEAAAAEAAATAPAWLPVVAAITIGIIAIIIVVVFVLAIFKFAGRSVPDYPDMSNPEDKAAVGRVLAASTTQDASLLASSIAEITRDNLDIIEANTNCQERNISCQQTKEKVEKAKTIIEALAIQGPADKSYAKNKILEAKSLLQEVTESTAATTTTKNTAAETIKELEQSTKEAEKILSLKTPILYLNPFDISMIKQGKVDKRIIAVLNKLISFSLSQNSPRWKMFKIARIFKASPYAKKEVPLAENKELISAHHFGQAIDITVVGQYKCTTKMFFSSKNPCVVGEYKCTTKMFFSSKTRWYPCYVYYQGGAPPSSDIGQASNYAELSIPLALAGAQNELGPINLKKTRSFWESFVEIGEQLLREELAIPSDYWYQGTSSIPEKMLAAYISKQTKVPPQAILEALAYNDEESLAKGVIASQLNLPIGSLEGKSWEERFINTYRAYIRKTLGLEGTELNNFNSAKELGSAIIQKHFGVSYWDTEEIDKIFSTIYLSKTYYQNLWHISKEELENILSQRDINVLAQKIGEKFQEDFIKKGASPYLERWLGLPEGDINSREYQIAAGRYILARALQLEDPQNAFSNPEYFFNQAPLSSATAADPCSLFSKDQKCPLYLFFTNPSDYIKRVKDSLEDENTTKINLEKEIIKLVTNGDPNIKSFQELWQDKEQRKKIRSALQQIAAQTLKDNLRIKFELPGIFTQIEEGNWGFALKLLGINKITDELTLPPNVLEKLTLPDANTEEVLKELAAFKTLSALGLNPWEIDQSTLPDGWFESGEKFASVATLLWLKNQGLDIITLDEQGKIQLNLQSFSDVVTFISGDSGEEFYAPQLASFLGISNEKLSSLIKSAGSEKPSATISALLTEMDRKFGLEAGSTLNLFSGKTPFSDWAESVWQNQVSQLDRQKINEVLNLPLENKIKFANLLEAIEQNDKEKLDNFFATIGYAQIGKAFNIPPETIKNLFNFETLSEEEVLLLQDNAIQILSQKLTSNKATYEALVMLFQNYFNKRPKSSRDASVPLETKPALKKTIAQSLDMPEEEASPFVENEIETGLLNFSVAQLTKAQKEYLGDEAMTYDEIKKLFTNTGETPTYSDPKTIATYHQKQREIKKELTQELVYNMTDITLIQADSSIPPGFTKALLEGSDEEKAEKISLWLATDLPQSVQEEIKNLILTQDISKIDWEDIARRSIPEINKYVTQIEKLKTTWEELQNIAQEINEIENLEDASAILQNTAAVFEIIGIKTDIPLQKIAQAIEMIDALKSIENIDELLQTPDLTLALLQIADEWLGLPSINIGGVEIGVSDLAAIFLFGMNPTTVLALKLAGPILKALGLIGTKCENPKTTAQKQIRTTISEILETKPYPPSQIITLRKEDVYFFSGLNNKGEISDGLKDILTEKYGPSKQRGQKGMFISPLMWDHVHVGY